MRRRRLLMAAVVFVACAKTETKTDSAAPAAAAATPAATAVTAADVAGTWNGQVMAQGSDSVLLDVEALQAGIAPKSPEQIDHVVGRMSGSNSKWAGKVVSMLASKPDSVLVRVRWEATKTP